MVVRSVVLFLACVLFACVSLPSLSVLGDDSSSSSSIASSTGADSGSGSASDSTTSSSTSSVSSVSVTGSSSSSSLSSSSSNSTSSTNSTSSSGIISSTATNHNSTNNSTAPALVRNPNSTRAHCWSDPGNDAWFSINDEPPWTCPRADVDGGVLGPRNQYDPCLNLIRYLNNSGWSNSGINSTMDFRPAYFCPAGSLVGGLNTTRKAPYRGRDSNNNLVDYRVPTQVTKGDPYPIMLVTSNALFNMKMLFMPKVDEFTQLEIGASHGVKFFSVPNTYISVEAADRSTGPRTRVFRVPAINSQTSQFYGQENDLGLNNIRYNYMNHPSDSCEQSAPNHFPGPNCDLYDGSSSPRYAVVPFWTVLINADNGVINDIHFDEGCDACSDQLCSPDGNCGVTEFGCVLQSSNTPNVSHVANFSIASMSKCALNRVRWFEEHLVDRAVQDQVYNDSIACDGYTANNIPTGWSLPELMQRDVTKQRSGYSSNTTDCSIKVYVGWTGTDQNGKYFTSAGKRLSVFRRFSIGAAYNSASTFADNALPAAPTDNNVPQG